MNPLGNPERPAFHLLQAGGQIAAAGLVHHRVIEFSAEIIMAVNVADFVIRLEIVVMRQSRRRLPRRTAQRPGVTRRADGFDELGVKSVLHRMEKRGVVEQTLPDTARFVLQTVFAHFPNLRMNADVPRRERLVRLQRVAPSCFEAGLALIFILQPDGVAFHQVLFVSGKFVKEVAGRVEKNVILVLQLDVGQRRIFRVGFSSVRILVLEEFHHRLNQQILAVLSPVDKAIGVAAVILHDFVIRQQPVFVRGFGPEVIRVRPAVINATLRKFAGEIIQTIQARRSHLGRIVFVADAFPASPGELVEADGVDAKLGEARGGEFGLRLLWSAEGVGQIDTPEFHRRLVGEFEVVAHHPHPAVFAGRLVQPVFEPNHARPHIAGGRHGKPVCARQHFGELINVRLLRQQLHRAGQMKSDGNGFLAGLEQLRRKLDAQRFVIGHRQRRAERRGEITERLGTKDQRFSCGLLARTANAQGQLALAAVRVLEKNVTILKLFLKADARDEHGQRDIVGGGKLEHHGNILVTAFPNALFELDDLTGRLAGHERSGEHQLIAGSLFSGTKIRPAPVWAPTAQGGREHFFPSAQKHKGQRIVRRNESTPASCLFGSEYRRGEKYAAQYGGGDGPRPTKAKCPT